MENRNQKNQSQENQPNAQDDKQLENKWRNIENSYRQKYPNVTDEDAKYREGEFDAMTKRVAEKTNRSDDQVRNEIRDWQEANREEE